MPLVRGHDTYSGVEVVVEGTYGTDPGSGYVRIPCLGEDFQIKREFYPKDRSMGALGAQQSADFGRGWHEASLTVIPRYNAQWFSWLMTHLFGGSEQVAAAKLVDGWAEGAGYSCHSYVNKSYQTRSSGSISAVPPGLTFRIHKSGPSAAGSMEVFTGSLVRRMTWDHPENDTPKVTFDFIGRLSTVAAVGSLAADAGGIRIRPRDLKNRTSLTHGWGIFKVGYAGAQDMDVTSFQLVIENGLEFAPSFINDPETIEKPGHVDLFKVTARIDSLLQQSEFNPSHSLAYAFGLGSTSGLRLRYVSDTDLAANVPYEADWYLKGAYITKAENGITTGGAPKTSYVLEAIQSAYTTAEAGIPANVSAMALYQSIGPSAAYATGAQGGN